jgi:sec-independent protein translocase protein TatC
MIHIKVTFICAIIICCPYLIYEIWRFISPALYKHEIVATRKAFLFASVLFYAGLVVGYTVVLPLMVNFFHSYSVSETVENTISLSSYMGTVTSTVLLFGLVFEFPTLIAILSQLGLVTKQMLKSGWRYAVCVVVVLAALITPSGDPFSLGVVSVPLFILYWISILVCKEALPEEEELDEQ